MKMYALYKGDDLLGIGTLAEIAAERGVKVDTIYFYKSPSYRKRTSEDKGLRLVEV